MENSNIASSTLTSGKCLKQIREEVSERKCVREREKRQDSPAV